MPSTDKKQEEEIKDLKKEPTADKSVKKGYNEKNPAQPEGAFNPDSANETRETEKK